MRIGGSSDRFAPQLGTNPLVTALEAIPPRMRKPEYWFRPSQLLRRLVRDRQGAARDQKVTLPWGAPLTIRRDEAIGQAIWRTGTYDLAVSEALLRLADPGETAVDVGANIGVMASAMAVAVGSTGKVLCFEPHPGLHLELAANIGRWKELLSWNHVERSDLALSEHPGEATLAMSSHFDTNRGTASLAALRPGEGQPADHVVVRTTTLDLALARSPAIGLLKVDVEGHELEVFKGATSLLSRGGVRDIVFEEYEPYPSPVTNFLESYGYEVFALRKGALGPSSQSPSKVRFQLQWETPNYLATNDAERATARLRPVGWRSLRRRAPLRSALAPVSARPAPTR